VRGEAAERHFHRSSVGAFRTRLTHDQRYGHAIAGCGQSGRQAGIVRLARFGAQDHIERNAPRTGGHQPVEHRGMIAARPGPGTQRGEAAPLDTDQQELSGWLAGKRREPGVGQRVVDGARRAGEVDAGGEAKRHERRQQLQEAAGSHHCRTIAHRRLPTEGRLHNIAGFMTELRTRSDDIKIRE
jgi:hypothetical protein